MTNEEIRMENQGSVGSSLVVFLAGMAVGAALAMLYAPQSGAETRAQLAEKTSEIKDRVSDMTTQVADKATELKGRVVSQAKDTMERAGETLSRSANNIDANAPVPPLGA